MMSSHHASPFFVQLHALVHQSLLAAVYRRQRLARYLCFVFISSGQCLRIPQFLWIFVN